MSDRSYTRRDALRVGSTALLGAVAGCIGDSGAQGGGTPTSEHPAGRGLASQPTQGADPTSAEVVIVAFSDPSCPYCKRFAEDTLPKIRSNVLDEGAAAYVYRGLGMVQAWGTPGAKALEATFERSPSAHWALERHYYDRQKHFAEETVLPKTKTFLDEQTDVDGDAVVSAVRNGEVDDAYHLDEASASDAGVRGTPTFFLFRDGHFLTKIVGAVGYDVFATALDV
ncbi:MAG: DsbA family protein [Halanaeroarchaeum sp.]